MEGDPVSNKSSLGCLGRAWAKKQAIKQADKQTKQNEKGKLRGENGYNEDHLICLPGLQSSPTEILNRGL